MSFASAAVPCLVLKLRRRPSLFFLPVLPCVVFISSGWLNKRSTRNTSAQLKHCVVSVTLFEVTEEEYASFSHSVKL